MKVRTIWHNVRIATCDEAMTELHDAALITNGPTIEWIGRESDMPRDLDREAKRVDLRNRWITPGLVDCHTHLVFAGNRAQEWAEILKGATYEEIARRGGGILSTVSATRRASEAELFDQAAPRLESLLAEGVTTIEVKSGYGLTLEDERKMLRVARELGRRYPVLVRTTFLGAHAVPPEFAGRADEFIDAVATEWLPALYDEGLIDMVDVFCDRIAFDTTQAERVLASAAKHQLPIRMHAEQLANIGATQLATRMRALSCDHLEYSNEDDVRTMVRAQTVAVLLPTAYLHLRETKQPPIESLRRHGASIAVASDCNPGSAPSASLLLAGALATRLFALTAAEVLAGITRNAAKACGAERRGMLKVGCAADFVVWDVAAVEEVLYWMGRAAPAMVVRDGVRLNSLGPQPFANDS
jgi:imidazolonepropionase